MRSNFLKIVSTIIIAAVVVCTATEAQADNISFNYQGRIKVQNEAFSGAGLIKLAILNTSGTAVLWSNDGTVGVATGQDPLPEPSAAIGQQIVDGVFSVAVGDVTIPGMAPLDSAIMVSDTPLRLRVWFNDGEKGFEQLTPDHKLTDLTLNKIQTGTQDFTIYVNGQTGNDANNGMTPQTAKKTITGAVDIIPDKVRCSITVSIAPGTYREMVRPHGFSVAYGNTLTFTGDTSWTPSSSGTPSVIIDGADAYGQGSARDYCFYARQCNGVVLEGIAFQNAKISAVRLESGTYTVSRCRAGGSDIDGRFSGYGFRAGPLCDAIFNECAATDNVSAGFEIDTSSRAHMSTCTAVRNYVGVFSTSNSEVQFFNFNNFSNNEIGVQANAMAAVGVWPSNSPATRTHIQNNRQFAARINWEGQFTPADAIMTGNAALYSRYYGTIIGLDPQ